MELTDLGFDPWIEERSAPLLRSGQSLARVTAVDRGAFLVRTRDGEVHAELAGKYRFDVESAANMPCVGDWVCVQGLGSGGPAKIHGIVPRRTFLRRKRPGNTVDFQMIAANIDIAFIVQACDFDFNPARLDRYLVMAREGGIDPWIILTKIDLIPPGQLEEFIEVVRQTRLPAGVLALSNMTGQGLDEFRALLRPGRTHCLLGSSGVGKTTLLNRLIGHDEFDTLEVSSTGEGVHTTSRRHLLLLDNGVLLIDTPGMRELGLLGAGEAVVDAFVEIGEHAANCRFADCTHTCEPGCAVLQAVRDGTLESERVQRYIKLRKETEFHNLSQLEKRRKDKAFGRFVKSARKTLKP
jgi:ribosome biogenesis GTPase